MNQFTWGIEYETNLLFKRRYGIDREVLFKKDKVQLTSEFWDVKLGHLPAAHDNLYHLNEIPKDDAGDIYNIESQIGVFKGINSMNKALQNISLLESVLHQIIQTKQIKIRSKLYPVSEYILINEGENTDGLYLDLKNKKPGVYPGKIEGTYGGYHNDLQENSINGKPQITITLPLTFVHRLFEMIYSYSENKYEEYRVPLEICSSLLFRIQSIGSLTHMEIKEIHGFLLYLLHYHTNYEYYVQLRNQNAINTYFKSIFFTKPRTNPAILFKMLNTNQHMALRILLDMLSEENKLEKVKSGDSSTSSDSSEPSWITYLRNLIPKMDNQDCVYTKGARLGNDIPNALYNYDKEEDVNTFIGMEMYEKSFEKNIPCVDPYDPVDMLNSSLPIISYNGSWDVKGSAPAQIWEWKNTGDKMVAFEFRDINELVYISLLMNNINPDEYLYQHLFENDMVSPSILKEMISIIFTFFEKLFNGKTTTIKHKKSKNKSTVNKLKSPKKSKVKKSKSPKVKKLKSPKVKKSKNCNADEVRDKKSKKCRNRIRCQNGFRRNSMGHCVKK